MRTALQLLGRVARLEAEARDAATPSTGATIAAILEGRDAGPRLSEEQLRQTRTGRLLLSRRQRFQDEGG